MLGRRNILLGFVFLRCWLAQSADANDALERYNARLAEIARAYQAQFAEIRQHQAAPEKLDARPFEEQIKELAVERTRAIAEAKLMFKREEQADRGHRATLSREQKQREFLAERRQAFEDGQRVFWERVTREEPKIARLWAARLQTTEERQRAFLAALTLRGARESESQATRQKAVEEGQSAFWAELFEQPNGASRDARSISPTRRATGRRSGL